MNSLLDFLPFEKYGRRIAFVEHFLYRSRKFTYAEILEGSQRIESSFAKKTVRAGDRVILWGQNSARWIMTFYACLRSKIVVVPVDASFSQAFVEKIQRATDARVICSDHEDAAWDELFQEEPLQGNLSSAGADDLLEIIYTSGTTGEPKGVMITHRNVLANLTPIHEEYLKYEKYAALFSPISFVHLIPLSHLFGQIMGLFLPQMLGGKVVFVDPAPGNVVPAIRKNRASVLISVPKQMSLLRKYAEGRYRFVAQRKKFRKGFTGILQRWWHYRKVHRNFGWKFWGFITGGAALPLIEEDFWKNLGFVVIQGYGLTETAPSVTITHPFKRMKRGYVGQVLPGVEVQIGEDGEILVRGPNVSPGYYRNETAGQEVFQDGWLHTGDIGSFDEQNNLQILGRKKEVIVTSEGLNVYPQDLEEVLNGDERVGESAVVAKESENGSQVHAVLVLNQGTSDAEADIIARANEKLEVFQRIRSFSRWSNRSLPRTSTGKLKRSEIAAKLSGADSRDSSFQPQTARLDSFTQRLLQGDVSADQRLEQDLGFTSLDRLELLIELEASTGKEIDDSSFAHAKTVAEIQILLQESSGNVERHYPSWNWTTWFFVRWFRSLIWYFVVFPLMPLRIKIQSTGGENLSSVKRPLLFVANHQSLLDAAIILRALPFGLRHSLAIAMGAGRAKIDLFAAGLFFNTYPLPVTSIGLKDALRHTGDLVDRGYSILIFPEGARTEDGKLLPFRNGAGVIANELRIAVVPVLLKGVFEIWPVFAHGPRKKGIVQLRFGAPFELSGKSPVEITRVIEAWFQQNYN